MNFVFLAAELENVVVCDVMSDVLFVCGVRGDVFCSGMMYDVLYVS